jgi:phage gp46-like protein
VLTLQISGQCKGIEAAMMEAYATNAAEVLSTADLVEVVLLAMITSLRVTVSRVLGWCKDGALARLF